MQAFHLIGSPGQARTADLVINSQIINPYRSNA